MFDKQINLVTLLQKDLSSFNHLEKFLLNLLHACVILEQYYWILFQYVCSFLKLDIINISAEVKWSSTHLHVLGTDKILGVFRISLYVILSQQHSASFKEFCFKGIDKWEKRWVERGRIRIRYVSL